MITALKALHIAALIAWCGGLLALPLMLTQHDPQHSQAQFSRLRRLTDYSYRLFVTPAAVIAIAAGTALIFARAVYEPWMFAKLAAVGLLVGQHAYQGLAVARVGETAGQQRPPGAALLVVLAICTVSAVLLLVLGKPVLTEGALPDWLLAPRYRPLPVDETLS